MTTNKQSRVHYNVTSTGLFGKERRECREMVESLGSKYSGNLEIYTTTHLLCHLQPGILSIRQALSDKMRLAMEAQIPLIGVQWVIDSYNAGKFLDTTKYLVIPSLNTAASPSAADSCSPIERLRSLPVIEEAPHTVCFHGHNTPTTNESDIGILQETSFSPPPILAEPVPGLISPNSPIFSPAVSPAQQAAANTANTLTTPECIGTDPTFSFHQSSEMEAARAFADLVIEARMSSGKPRTPSPAALSWAQASAVTLGEVYPGGPSVCTLQGLRKHHGATDAATATFYLSATATTDAGRELVFTAGDTAHGAKMLYDVESATGRRDHALVLVKNIYTLAATPGEVWMEHHYLFTPEDLLERPVWTAALNQHSTLDGELLLSVGSYFSPLHLITGDFGVYIPPESSNSNNKVKKKGVGEELGPHVAVYFWPIYKVAAAFDAATAAVANLREALTSFRA